MAINSILVLLKKWENKAELVEYINKEVYYYKFTLVRCMIKYTESSSYI